MAHPAQAAVTTGRQTGAHPGRAADAAPNSSPCNSSPADAWAQLAPLAPASPTLEEARVVTLARRDPAHVPFDLLCTRLQRMMLRNGWRRIGVTSATVGCGKTVTVANLAFSIARRPDLRCLLLDLDLAAPRLSRLFTPGGHSPLPALLAGQTTAQACFGRVSASLAAGLTPKPVDDPGRLLHWRGTAAALDRLAERYAPDVMLFDLPPVFAGDAALAALSLLDCVVLVAAAGQSRASEIEAAEAILAEQLPVLGVILNKADTPADQPAYGGYGYGDPAGMGTGQTGVPAPPDRGPPGAASQPSRH